MLGMLVEVPPDERTGGDHLLLVPLGPFESPVDHLAGDAPAPEGARCEGVLEVQGVVVDADVVQDALAAFDLATNRLLLPS